MKNYDKKKILIIGSGPIVVGQACEFDYAGVQACKLLKEEGHKVILINSNSSSVMTGLHLADATYIEEINMLNLEQIIHKEKPDALLPTLGGQVALNSALSLYESGILHAYGVALIGTSYESIKRAEDRNLFRKIIDEIELEGSQVFQISNLNDIETCPISSENPMIIRSSFTLGGSGCQQIMTREALKKAYELSVKNGESIIEIENSLLGWREFEMEIVCDKKGNAVIVCCIENIDAVGIHTGDSMSVVPAQTLRDKELQEMRRAALKIIKAVGLKSGGANIQFAIHPTTRELRVVEMNPRVSRSSALASKATGYPIARIATKLALGFTLDEIVYENLKGAQVTAAFEPVVDYVVTKIPRFEIERFSTLSPFLGLRMKSIGEVMGIGQNFLASLNKALESLEIEEPCCMAISTSTLMSWIQENHYARIFYLMELLRRGISSEILVNQAAMDTWFLEQFCKIINLEKQLKHSWGASGFEDKLQQAKRNGFSDRRLGKLLNLPEKKIFFFRKEKAILPTYKRIDSCAAEIPTTGSSFYSTYEESCEVPVSKKKKALIIGSGPNRIGQGLEFDYSCVHVCHTLKEAGYESILINSNPATVSTDYDVADRLYFEPLQPEYVLAVIEREQPHKILYQFGGQTALQIALQLADYLPLIKKSLLPVTKCENRSEFKKIVASLGYTVPPSIVIESMKKLKGMTRKKNLFPLIVRPSYVISGTRMRLLRNHNEANHYLAGLSEKLNIFPLLIEQFLQEAQEIEIEGISDGKSVHISAIIEQMEPAGIHSGDSHSIFPAQSLSNALQKIIAKQTRELVKALGIFGPFNVQLALQKDKIFFLEANPRASRTLPFLEKITAKPLVALATRCLLGEMVVEETHDILPLFVAIRQPVYSQVLGAAGEEGDRVPEMRSTGEKMIIGVTFSEAQKKLRDKTYINPFSLQAIASTCR